MLDLGTITGGRHVVEGVWGQPLYLGIYIDNCFDVGRVNNIHFWPFVRAFYYYFFFHQLIALVELLTSFLYWLDCSACNCLSTWSL